jgi:hypothetical protein
MAVKPTGHSSRKRSPMQAADWSSLKGHERRRVIHVSRNVVTIDIMLTHADAIPFILLC